MAFNQSWDETSPTDSDYGYQIDDFIRNLKEAIRERLAVEHAFYSDETGHSDVGEHKKGSARINFGAAANKPSNNSNNPGAVFIATDTGTFQYDNGSSWVDIVTSGAIVDGAVTTAKIANSGVTKPKIKTATGSTSGTLGKESAVNIVMHDYSFFPNIYAENIPIRLICYGNVKTDTIGRFALYNAHNTINYDYAVRWRYITASNNPQIWVVQDPITGEIISIWHSDDPPEIETDNPFKTIPIQHYDREGKPYGIINYIEIPGFLDEFRATLGAGFKEVKKRYNLREKSIRPKNLPANIKFAVLKRR